MRKKGKEVYIVVEKEVERKLSLNYDGNKRLHLWKWVSRSSLFLFLFIELHIPMAAPTKVY